MHSPSRVVHLLMTTLSVEVVVVEAEVETVTEVVAVEAVVGTGVEIVPRALLAHPGHALTSAMPMHSLLFKAQFLGIFFLGR